MGGEFFLYFEGVFYFIFIAFTTKDKEKKLTKVHRDKLFPFYR